MSEALALARLLKRKLEMMLLRALVNLSDDTQAMQLVQLTTIGGAVRSNVEHLQPFGLSANPDAGAEAILVSIMGNGAHPVAIVVDDRRYRPKNLQIGEVILYSKFGDYIKLHADHTIEVYSQNQVTVNATNNVNVTAPNVNVNASTKVTLTTPLVECTQNMKVDGNLEVDGTSDLKGNVTMEGNGTVAGELDVTAGPLKVGGVVVSVP